MFVLLVSQAVEKGDSGYIENVMPLSAVTTGMILGAAVAVCTEDILRTCQSLQVPCSAQVPSLVPRSISSLGERDT